MILCQLHSFCNFTSQSYVSSFAQNIYKHALLHSVQSIVQVGLGVLQNLLIVLQQVVVYKKLLHLALKVGLHSVFEVAWVFVFYENIEFVAAVVRVVPVFLPS